MERNQFSLLSHISIIFFWFTLFCVFLFLPNIGKLVRIEKSITVATWAELIDPDYLAEFEKETGIKVYISYFENNEELLVKLRATKGKGYDLVSPSDYIVEKLISEHLLQPLDKTQLTFWDRLNPRLLHRFYDPKSQYAIPYYWGIYGLGIDKDFFGAVPKASWNLLLENPSFTAQEYNLPNKFTVSMIDHPREAFFIVAQYLFGTTQDLTEQQILVIKQKLIEQKKWVEAYTEFRADYLLLSKTSPVVVITTPLIWRLMKIQSNIEFLVPHEGSFMIIDTWVIPKASNKQTLIYQFLNFLYKKEAIKHHFNKYTFFPATLELDALLKEGNVRGSIYEAHFDQTKNLHFFKNLLPDSLLNNIWISLKAA